jgi:sugar/nucleoside kinase (ribokinase family)
MCWLSVWGRAKRCEPLKAAQFATKAVALSVARNGAARHAPTQAEAEAFIAA